MTRLYKNNAVGRLSAPAAAGDATITLSTGEGARFPSFSGGNTAWCTIEDRRTGLDEVCIITGRSGDILNVTRGQDNTTALDWAIGAVVSMRINAALMEELRDASYDKATADSRFVNASGDTMTGALTLPGAPSSTNQAATKGYVDTQVASVAGLTDAPNDGKSYVRRNLAWSEGVLKTYVDGADATLAAADAALDARLDAVEPDLAALNAEVDGMPHEAPNDTDIYGRKGNAWVASVTKVDFDTQIALRLTDAPVNGQSYYRKDGGWVALGSTVLDAPSDGKIYARRNAAWTQVVQNAPNKLINGEFEFIQRGTPLTQVSLGSGVEAYTFDRWFTHCNPGLSCVAARGISTLGSNNNAQYFGDFNFSGSGVAGSFIEQRIESVFTLSGKTVTVSGMLGLLAAGSVTISLTQFFGTGGSPSIQVVTPVGSVALPGGGINTYFSLSVALPSIAGKTLGSNGDDYLSVKISISSANAQRLFATHLSLVEGDQTQNPDPFVRRSKEEEFSLCQRFYQTVTAHFSGNVTNAVAYYAIGNMSVKMRAIPTLSGVDLGAALFPSSPGTLAVIGGADGNMVRDGRVCTGSGNGGIIATNIFCNAEL